MKVSTVTDNDITQPVLQCQPAISLDCDVSFIVAEREAVAQCEVERVAIRDRISSLGRSIATEVVRLDLTRFEVGRVMTDIVARAEQIRRGLTETGQDNDAATVLADIIRDDTARNCGGADHIISLLGGHVSLMSTEIRNRAASQVVTA